MKGSRVSAERTSTSSVDWWTSSRLYLVLAFKINKIRAFYREFATILWRTVASLCERKVEIVWEASGLRRRRVATVIKAGGRWPSTLVAVAISHRRRRSSSWTIAAGHSSQSSLLLDAHLRLALFLYTCLWSCSFLVLWILCAAIL